MTNPCYIAINAMTEQEYSPGYPEESSRMVQG
jgi:hypothetical protein